LARTSTFDDPAARHGATAGHNETDGAFVQCCMTTLARPEVVVAESQVEKQP
jgi:hypothetical protein